MFNVRSLLNLRQFSGTRGPIGALEPISRYRQDKARVLTAQGAISACMTCRNDASRFCDNIADQLSGFGVIGTEKYPASAIIGLEEHLTLQLAAPQTLPKIVELPTGVAGKTAPGWLGVATLVIAGIVRSADQTIPETQLIRVIRGIATGLRQKAGECCRSQVERRVLPQTKPRLWLRGRYRTRRPE